MITNNEEQSPALEVSMAKVLIIDDSRFARLKLGDNIKAAGFDIIEAGNGEEGLLITQQQRPDIIICDLLMPELDGFGFLEKLKAEGINVPVMILTSDIQDKTRNRALELGARDLINKPPRYEEVVEKLNKILRA